MSVVLVPLHDAVAVEKAGHEAQAVQVAAPAVD